MKKTFKLVLLIPFFALLMFTSCQNEVTDVTQPTQEQIIQPQSNLSSMMRSASTNNGTADNVIDNADCLSINLPVTIVVNSITITINTLEDLELIHEIYEEFSDDDDVLEIVFPITIILNDYTEVVIENAEELEQFVERCNDTDDVMECADFVYPISFSIYNTAFQIIETVEINDDEELYEFMQRIEDANEAILASLNFPVKIKYANGDYVEVNSNSELEAAFAEAENMCDEPSGCTIDDVDGYLIDCKWNIHYFNEDDHLRPYNMWFKENGELKVAKADGSVEKIGTWNTSETDNGVVITISDIEGFEEELNGDWLVKECDDDKFKIIKQDAQGATVTRLVIKKKCEDEPDCGAQEIRMNLKDCHWYYGTNINDENKPGKFFFQEDGTVKIINPDTNAEVFGTWDVSLTDYGIKVILELPEPYSDMSGYWKVYECDDDRIKIIRDDYYIVFEKECGNGCDMSLAAAKNFILECSVISALYDENGNLLNYYNFNFKPNTQFLVYENTVGNNGNWTMTETNDGVKLTLENIPDFNMLDGEWFYVDCYSEGLIFKQQTDTGYRKLKLEMDCNNALGCFEDTEIVACEDGDTFDGITTFDLTSIYVNCDQNSVEITFHESEADAEANTAAISNPSSYTNTNNQQPIWVRIEIPNTGVYQIFFIVLFVEDCSTASCSETDVDNFLSEPNCHWVPVDLNGSNDYNTYDFYFDANQNLVIKDANDAETVGTWSTSSGTGAGVEVQISQIAAGQLDVFNETWTVVECDSERMVLKNTNDEQLVLERECQ